MFGVNSFGAPYFGQVLPSGVARLSVAAVIIAVATDASLTTAAPCAASAGIGVGSVEASLTVQGPLLADAGCAIGTTAALALRAVLAATARIPVGTAAAVTQQADLRADATVAVGVTVPRLDVGAVTLASSAAWRVACAAAKLSTLPADLRSAPAVHLGTIASLTQTGVGATSIVIAFGGAIVTPHVRVGSVEIEDILNEAPNTCHFVCETDPPAIGTDVKIGLQNLLVPNLLFAGTVKRRAQRYEAKTTDLFWEIECEDYTYLLNRRRVFGTWSNVSASTVARAILASFTSGFSNAGIVNGLPEVTVTFNGATVMEALSQLAALIGGYTKVDYGKVVWLFVTDQGVPPTPITPDNRTLQYKPPITPTLDVSQTRTRVHVRGAAVAVVGPADAHLGPVPLLVCNGASTPGYSGAVTTKTINYNVVAGSHILLAFVAGDFAADRITGATCAGAPMTLFDKFYSGWEWFYLFGIFDPPSGVQPITVTASAQCALIDISAATYAGVTGVTPATRGATTSGTPTFAVPLPPMITGWAVSFVLCSSRVSVSVAGGVLRASGTTDIPVFIADSAAAMSTPITFSSATATNWAGFCIGLVAAPSAIQNIPIPVADATMFGATGGTVISDDGQILPYTGKDPGNVGGSVIIGNISGPSFGGSPALAPAVAGYLSGTYRWAIAFGNPQGETTIGAPSAALFCPDVTSPTNAPGVGATGTVGPLVGAYQYRVAYLTTLGETLPGSTIGRTATALAPPSITAGTAPGLSRLSPGTYKWVATYVTQYGETAAGSPIQSTQPDIAIPFPPSVVNANGAGPLAAGAPYAYRATFVTIDGESAPGTSVTHTPSALALPGVGGFNPNNGFGGLLGGAYYYGITYVTGLGESGMNIQYGGSGLAMGYPGWYPSWSGSQDGNGRIEKGWTYIWAASYYSDTYGETALGPQSSSLFIGGSVPVRLLMNISNFRPTGADGVRIYRAIAGLGGFALNKEFRFASGVPTQYWDDISQGECGSNYPIQTIRAGVCMQVLMYPSNETGVIARRLYRTKAGGAEYFLVSEIQNNAQAQITDYFFDNQLAVRNPAQPTTGRIAQVTVPTGPPGTIARRLYRSKRDVTTAWFFLGDLRDNTTLTFLDAIPDTALASSMPTANTGGSNGIPQITVPSGPSGVIARRLYRTQANGQTYALVAEFTGNAATVFTDNVPDAGLSGAAPPPSSTAGGDQHLITSIPIGPTGTLARLLYRTKAGGGEYGLVTRLSDNTTTTFLDTVPDGNLGGGVSLVNEAGSSAVNLSAIPLGPAGVTQRIIYRTLAGGSEFFYVGTLDNNTATTFLDTRGDKDLGRAPVAVSTIGALIGDNLLVLNTVANFPPAGWVLIDNQYIRYTTITGTTLSGIPVAGAGAIIAPIRGGSAVLTVAQLIGVSSLVTPLTVGSRLALWVTSNSANGQAALAAVEGGDGVHEFVVVDASLDTIPNCQARGLAELALFEFAQVQLDYASRDRLTRSGARVSVTLPAPWNLSGEFIIQSVRITEIDIAPRTFPKYLVRCSDTKFSLEDLLRHVILAA